MAPEKQDDCIFCLPTFQDQFFKRLDEDREKNESDHRSIKLMIMGNTIGLLGLIAVLIAKDYLTIQDLHDIRQIAFIIMEPARILFTRGF